MWNPGITWTAMWNPGITWTAMWNPGNTGPLQSPRIWRAIDPCVSPGSPYGSICRVCRCAGGLLFREKKFWEKSFLRSSANAKKIIINFYFGSPAALLLLLLLLLLKELVKNS
jgi:hypothetical protein